MNIESFETTCCIVGGGPAGMMLGYLFARAGIRVTVLEKHADFFRDFRGDTVHPSTLQVFHELGLLEDLLQIPHQQVNTVGGVLGDFPFEAANFRLVPAQCKYVALMPQWDFLNLLAREAAKFATFDLRMEHQCTGLLRGGGRILGVEARKPDGTSVHIRAELVIGSDGRHSVTRSEAGFEVQDFGVPIDVLWFHISRKPDDPEKVFGNINYGSMLVLINRGDYFQAGLIIRKGSSEEIKQRGLEQFRERIRQIAPYLGDRVHEIADWDQVKLLTVQINRLKEWSREGLLCIGDAAHAMSPAGGVGINLAIQDAVATANLLSRPLLEWRVTSDLLAAVQKRREFPTRVTQFFQVNAHKMFEYVFRNPGPLNAPWQFKAAVRIPGLQYAMGYMIGMGARPEHVRDSVPQERRAKTWIRAAALAAGVAAGMAVVIAGSRRRWAAG